VDVRVENALNGCESETRYIENARSGCASTARYLEKAVVDVKVQQGT